MPEIMTVKQFTHEQLETLSGVKRAVFGLITNNGTTKPTPTMGAAANRFFDFLDDAALWLQQVSVFAERCDEVVELNADPKAQGLSVVEGGGNADGSQQ